MNDAMVAFSCSWHPQGRAAPHPPPPPPKPARSSSRRPEVLPRGASHDSLVCPHYPCEYREDKTEKEGGGGVTARDKSGGFLLKLVYLEFIIVYSKSSHIHTTWLDSPYENTTLCNALGMRSAPESI